MSCCQVNTLSNPLDTSQLQKELVEARSSANYYKDLHQRNIAIRERTCREHDREIQKLKQKHKIEVDHLQNEIAELKAKIKLRERQLFGKKSEKKKTGKKKQPKGFKRKRGQQKQNKSPPRRDYSHLPVTVEPQEIPEDERLCPCCGCPYSDIESTEDSEILEVHVKAHRRRICRKKYRRSCSCQSQPIIITAPNVSKILPKSRLGNSVWIYCLLQKFWHSQPLCRTIQGLGAQGLPIAAGTIIGGFMRLLPLFRDVYRAITKKSLTDPHWHADETGWKVFESLEGKANHRWFLWVFRSKSTAVFVLNPSRSTQVIKNFFGQESSGIISCDRYPAYFCFTSQSGGRFLIAYCWAHVRRDFLSLAANWPIHESWGMSWVEAIRDLYRLNKDRQSQVTGSIEALKCQKKLEEEAIAFKKRVDEQLENEELREPCRKVLKSLKRHWEGLTTFIKHPDVPMDNNTAERELRNGVVGRKNYYGSGSKKSAEFTAIAFTVIQTLLLWKINPESWFKEFFNYVGGDWNKNLDPWMPWNLSADKRRELSLKNYHGPP